MIYCIIVYHCVYIMIYDTSILLFITKFVSMKSIGSTNREAFELLLGQATKKLDL